MNLILDGFAHYGSNAAGRLNMLDGAWAQLAGTTHPTTDNPRTGTHALKDTSTTGLFARRALPALRSKVFFSAAIYISALPSNNNTFRLCEFRDNANNELFDARVSTTGEVVLVSHSGGATTRGTSAPGAVPAGQYFHAEFMAHANGASSSMECRINGVTVVSATGFGGGSTQIAQFAMGRTTVLLSGAEPYWFADLRVGDDQGGVNDDFMGDRRVFTHFPNRDGSPSEWTPSAGSDKYAMVDEADPDDDSTYIESEAEGSLQRLGFTPLDASVSAIGGIALVSYVKKTDAGPCFIAQNVVAQSGDKTLGDEYAPGLGYLYAHQLFDLNPDGLVPWTPTEVDALESEIEHVGGS